VWTLATNKDDNESVYCPMCTSCGETGCCSPLACQQDPNGMYCRGNLNELKFGYLMFEDLYNLISKDEKLSETLSEIYNKNWDIIFNPNHDEEDI